MEIVSTLAKMSVQYNDPVKYILPAEGHFIKMNPLIGREISLEFLNEKYCGCCGSNFKSLFRMGFCRDCFFSSPETADSIIRPELSKAHLGEEERDIQFEKAYQLQPHAVYLANSGGLKAGVTRSKAKINRWIDQGASSAIVFAETSNRYEAGIIEVALKEFVSDKTPWQRMLKNEDPVLDLLREKERLLALLPDKYHKFRSEDDEIYQLQFPVRAYQNRINSISLDKNPSIQVKLQGIRGQYLIFEGGGVLNVRGHSGYRVKILF